MVTRWLQPGVHKTIIRNLTLQVSNSISDYDVVVKICQVICNKFTIFHGTREFMDVFTKVTNDTYSESSDSYATSLHSISLRYIGMLSIHLHLTFPRGLFPSGFLTEDLGEFIFFACVICFSHLSHLLIINIDIYNLFSVS